jgi:predicted RND superfamily exporter protein
MTRLAAAINNRIENAFDRLGRYISCHPKAILTTTCVVLACLTVGLTTVKFETDVYKLWIERDSRLHAERQFMSTEFGNTGVRSQFILATSRDGNTVLTSHLLRQWLHLSKVAQNISVVFDGTTYKWNDMCDRIPNSQLDLPCSKYTVLDCFSEGDFDFFLPPYPGVPPNVFTAKPSFEGKTENELLDVVRNSCRNWSNTPIPENFMFARSSQDKVQSLQFVLRVLGKQSLAQRIYATTNPTSAQIDAADSLILQWEQAFLNAMGTASSNYDFDVSYFAKRSEADLMEGASSGDIALIALGYCCMIAFVCFAFARRKWNESRVLAGFVGVMLVFFSVFASLGLSALFGTYFTALHLQVLPFLAMGLGVDDMFVLASAFKYRPDIDLRDVCANCMREAASSITLTSLTNFIAFLVASAVPLPNVSYFCLTAAVVVVINYGTLLFGFVSVLCLDAQWSRSKPSRSESVTPVSQPVAADRLSNIVVGETNLKSNGDPSSQEAAYFSSVSPQTSQSAVGGSPKPIHGASSKGNTPPKWQAQLISAYAKYLQSVPGLIVSLSLAAGLLGLAVYGATTVKEGLALGDIAPGT